MKVLCPSQEISLALRFIPMIRMNDEVNKTGKHFQIRETKEIVISFSRIENN